MNDSGKNEWFVIHSNDAPWLENDRFGQYCNFEGDRRFPQIGVNIHIIKPGQPNCFYHREAGQENFFVLSGECKLIIEEQVQELRTGHFVHCPPETRHVFVGSGSKPCAILMIGYRPDQNSIHYPTSTVAGEFNATVEKATSSPREAYSQTGKFTVMKEVPWSLE